MTTPMEEDKKDLGPIASGEQNAIPVSTQPELVHVNHVLDNGVFLAPYPGKRKTTTRLERIAYYTYFIGCTSLGPFVYASSMFQTVLSMAGFDPTEESYGEVPCGYGACYVRWAGKDMATSSVLLNLNGIGFAVQVVVFLLLGATADFGNFRPYILVAWTLITAGTGLGWWALQDPSKWQILAGMYVIQTIGYQMVISFACAPLATLARDMPVMQASELEVAAGTKTLKEHEELDMLTKNHVSDLSYAISAAAAVVTLCINLGILKAINYDENQLKGYAALMVFTSALWIVFSIPWFFLEQKRPGRPLAKGENYMTVIPKTLWEAMKAIVQLKQAFLCMLAYFLITDTLTTATSVTSTLTYSSISFSPFKLSAAGMIGFGTQGISIYAIYWLQKWFKFSTKSIVLFSVASGTFLSIWGLVGVGTHKIGFRNEWEFFFQQTIFGLGVTPWYQVSRTLITEVVPANHLYLFFCLFNVVGQTSSFIGPFITARIIDDHEGNQSYAFAFLFPMFVAGGALLACVNVKKARDESVAFMARRLEKDMAAVAHGKADGTLEVVA